MAMSRWIFAAGPAIDPASGRSGHRMMNRRTFLRGLTLGTLSVPLGAQAQPAGKVWRIGYLSAASRVDAFESALAQGLRDAGYVSGQTVVIESRFADGSVDRLPRLA